MASYSFIDMHIHTTHSNEPGCRDTVTDVLVDAEKNATEIGKKCLISITDHNSALGVIEAKNLLKSGQYPNVNIISGMEITADMSEFNSMFNGRQVFKRAHILAYGFDENNPKIIEYSKKYGGISGTFLKFSEIAKMVREAGGYLVIAHPGLIKLNATGLSSYNGELNKDKIIEAGNNARGSKSILRMIPNSKEILEIVYKKAQELSDNLIVGLEQYHPDNYPFGMDKKIEEICQQEGLIPTAGSDYHGPKLHTQFSIGNTFTTQFQEYYKQDNPSVSKFRNGIHISHLPGIEYLTNDKPEDEKTEMIDHSGRIISKEEYDKLRENLRTKSPQVYDGNRYVKGEKSKNKKHYYTNNNRKNNRKNKHKKNRYHKKFY